MEIDIKGVSLYFFVNAVEHVRSIGATRLEIFKGQRQNEGPWLLAFIIIDGRRHTCATVEAWEGQTLDEQARDLARQIETFFPQPPFDHGV